MDYELRERLNRIEGLFVEVVNQLKKLNGESNVTVTLTHYASGTVMNFDDIWKENILRVTECGP